MDLIAIGVAAANGGSGGGTSGKDGKDGFSPTVNVTEIDGGHEVNITDKNGTKSFEVLNGEKGDKGDKGDTGSDGKDGSNGKDGYTPVKGTDYWTESDKKEIVDEAIEEIKEIQPTFVELTESDILEKVGLSDEELEGLSTVISDNETRTDKTWSSSKIYGEVNKVTSDISSVSERVTELENAGQSNPEFAESVDWLADNGDIAKMYVLPDGYLYANQEVEHTTTVETVDNETNLLPTATDESGAIYNGKGYKEQTAIESGVEIVDSSKCLTGLIPITPTRGYVLGNNVVIFKNLNNPTIDNIFVSFYNSEKTYIHQISQSSFVLEENYSGNAKSAYKLTDNGYLERIDFAGLISYMANNIETPAYIRIAINGINDNSQIMFGKKITKEEKVITNEFANTGISYVPIANDFDTDDYKTDDNVGNYIDNLIPTPTFTAGYIKYNDSIVESTTHKYSNYVEVKEQQPIIIENFNCLSQTYIFCYDENKTLVYKVAGKNGYVTSYEFIPPLGVKFIRYLIANEQEATNKINYKNQIDRNYFEKALLKSWYETAYKKIKVPFEKATEFPVITLIDDDTPTIESTRLYRDTLTALGVKGGYAVITSKLESVNGLTEQLLGFEEEGFHMVVHANEHSPIYRPDAENRNLVEVEVDIVKALRQMKSAGFVNYKYWCTPYGATDTDIQNLAKKYDFKCLVSSGCDEIVTTNDNRGRYNIARYTFNYDTTGAVLTRAKELVDECIANNGWLLITTHFSDEGWSDDVSTLNEFINYALEKGVQFKTLGEAFNIREPIYNLYEMF